MEDKNSTQPMRQGKVFHGDKTGERGTQKTRNNERDKKIEKKSEIEEMLEDKSGMYNCSACNRKYKTKHKLIKHMDTTHKFLVINNNNFNIVPKYYDSTPFGRKKILIGELSSYTNLLKKINQIENFDIEKSINEYLEWDGKTSVSELCLFVWASHMLLPENYLYLSQNGYISRERSLYEFMTGVKYKLDSSRAYAPDCTLNYRIYSK